MKQWHEGPNTRHAQNDAAHRYELRVDAAHRRADWTSWRYGECVYWELNGLTYDVSNARIIPILSKREERNNADHV